MKKYLSFFMVIFFLNCSLKQVKTVSIEGDWYTGMKNKEDSKEVIKDSSNYIYEEVFLTENRVFHFQNILGYRAPYFYKIKNDTLFSSYNLNEGYKFFGKIITLNDNRFSLEANNKRLDFFRLLDVKNTLSNFITKRDTDDLVFDQKGTTYTQGFINRSEKYYSTLK